MLRYCHLCLLPILPPEPGGLPICQECFTAVREKPEQIRREIVLKLVATVQQDEQTKAMSRLAEGVRDALAYAKSAGTYFAEKFNDAIRSYQNRKPYRPWEDDPANRWKKGVDRQDDEIDDEDDDSDGPG